MAKASDAFVVVREEVEASLEQAGRMFSQWQALPANSPTREQLGSELKTKLKSIQWDLEDLEETIQIVETQRERFQHLPESELASRKKFIEQSRTALQEMQRATSVKAAKAKQQQQQRAVSRSHLRHTSGCSTWHVTQDMDRNYVRLDTSPSIARRAWFCTNVFAWCLHCLGELWN
eukprot:m.25885 g.25885  ORF g.25885 m.25885 type:complete len:176 (-) comp8776_c0_seq3:112-639(-)